MQDEPKESKDNNFMYSYLICKQCYSIGTLEFLLRGKVSEGHNDLSVREELDDLFFHSSTCLSRVELH